MIPHIQKILFPTDLSENARHAFQYAISLAHAYNAKITVMHVLEELSPSTLTIVKEIVGDQRWSELKRENEGRVMAAVEKRLTDFCDEISRDQPECPFIIEDIIVLAGHPVDQIITRAEKHSFDLIVMGSHGHGTLTEAMLGSTSQRVIRRSRKPVLTVRAPDKG